MFQSAGGKLCLQDVFLYYYYYYYFTVSNYDNRILEEL